MMTQVRRYFSEIKPMDTASWMCVCVDIFIYILPYISVKSHTLADDTQSGAFGPVAKETKIKNLRLYPCVIYGFYSYVILFSFIIVSTP